MDSEKKDIVGLIAKVIAEGIVEFFITSDIFLSDCTIIVHSI